MWRSNKPRDDSHIEARRAVRRNQKSPVGCNLTMTTTTAARVIFVFSFPEGRTEKWVSPRCCCRRAVTTFPDRSYRTIGAWQMTACCNTLDYWRRSQSAGSSLATIARDDPPLKPRDLSFSKERTRRGVVRIVSRVMDDYSKILASVTASIHRYHTHHISRRMPII